MIQAGAVGTPVLGYKWYDVNGGTNVAAGTTNGALLNAPLTVSNVPAAWNGDTLQLTVTNAYGTANATVSLTVNTNRPQITLNLPSPVTVVSGQSYIYSIAVTGPQPFFYQWYNAGMPVAGQTNPAYAVTAGSPGSTTYSVVVTNFSGAVTSAVSTFTSIGLPPAPTTAYATNLLRLNPAGYWPMHETEAAAPGDVEVNYGSLGVLGSAYYPDWAENSGAFARQAPGILTFDSDPAVFFTDNIGIGNTVFWTNGLYIAHNSPLTTLNPPFTVECWCKPTTSGGGQDVWAQFGDEGLNAGPAGGTSGNYDGIQLVYNGTSFTVYGEYNGVQTALSSTSGTPTNQWYYLVVTCDANTNITLFVNGTAAATVNSVGKYTPDYWTPLTVGSGRGGTRSTAGPIDEFAVYTNVISDISTHYNDARAGAPGQYFNDVQSDNPVIYLRMDAPAYSSPPLNTWPILLNYGGAGTNGVYTPGTVPGVVSGPAFAGLPGAVVAQLSGVSSFADAGYAAAFNPTGANASFTVAAMFRSNPCDNRVQTVVGHGTNSWQLSMTTNGRLVFNAGNGNGSDEGTGQNAGDLQTSGVYNDGLWHQVVAVNQRNVISIYVDGVLDTNGTPTGITPASVIPGNTSDVLIGSDPSYTNNPAGVGRQFAGQICEVAFFTNALSAGQVAALYVATTTNVAPFFAPAPPASASAAIGGTLVLPAVAVGTTPLYYQWHDVNGGTNVATGSTGANPLDVTLTVSNVPAAWNGDTLQLTVTNLYGTTNVSVALTITNAVNTNPTNMVLSVTNSQLTLYWPADHIGWELQSNSVGLTATDAWFNVPGSTATNQIIITPAATKTNVFYRMMYPQQ